MTLTKAIEAARDILTGHGDKFNPYQDTYNKALAALPDKPKSEDEIRKIIDIELANKTPSIVSLIIFRALKAANCLYVEE